MKSQENPCWGSVAPAPRSTDSGGKNSRGVLRRKFYSRSARILQTPSSFPRFGTALRWMSPSNAAALGLRQTACAVQPWAPDLCSERFEVESRTGAVALASRWHLGWAFASPPQSGWAWLCFLFPLIEPDRRSYRIRLSEKTHDVTCDAACNC